MIQNHVHVHVLRLHPVAMADVQHHDIDIRIGGTGETREYHQMVHEHLHPMSGTENVAMHYLTTTTEVENATVHDHDRPDRRTAERRSTNITVNEALLPHDQDLRMVMRVTDGRGRCRTSIVTGEKRSG